MRKLFTNKKTIRIIKPALQAVALVSLTLNVNGQILWGAGSSNTAADEAGRFAKDFGTPDSWTAKGISSHDALWTRTTTGVSQGNYWLDKEPFKSPTLSDGAALFDSDYLISKASVRGPHLAELHSPTIDLTGLSAGDPIQVKAFVYYRFLSSEKFTLGFSTDNGANWKNYALDVAGNTSNTIYGQDFVKIRLTGATEGVTDFSKCKLRLLFDAKYYFAMVDDISLEKVPANDIAFPVFSEYNFRSTISPAPYAQFPLKYGIKASENDFVYGAVVANKGRVAIQSSANAKLTLELLKSSGESWNSVFKKEVAINKNIPAFDTVEVRGDMSDDFNAVFEANGAGKYRFTYHVGSSLTDGDAGNNDMSHDFTVTDDINALFSAVPLNNEGKPESNCSAFPAKTADMVIQTLEQGVYFYFPDQTDLAIESVYYAVDVPLTTFRASYPVNIRIYGYEDLEQNSLIYPSLISAVGFDTINVNGDNLGEFLDRQVKVYDAATSEEGLRLNSKTGIYFVSVYQQNLNGLVDIDGVKRSVNPAGYLNNNINLGSDINYLYTMRSIVTQGSAGQDSQSKKSFTGYTGMSFTPSIALKLMQAKPVGVNAPANSMDEKNVSIYPNPVTDQLKMNVQLNEPAENATFILTNAQGMVLTMERFKQVQKMEYTLNTEKLVPGTYYLHMKTEQGNIAKKFIKY